MGNPGNLGDIMGAKHCQVKSSRIGLAGGV